MPSIDPHSLERSRRMRPNRLRCLCRPLARLPEIIVTNIQGTVKSSSNECRMGCLANKQRRFAKTRFVDLICQFLESFVFGEVKDELIRSGIAENFSDFASLSDFAL